MKRTTMEYSIKVGTPEGTEIEPHTVTVDNIGTEPTPYCEDCGADLIDEEDVRVGKCDACQRDPYRRSH